MKRNYMYYIVYMYSKLPGPQCCGSVVIHRTKPIDCETELISVRDYIESQTPHNNVVILNMILLNNKGKI